MSSSAATSLRQLPVLGTPLLVTSYDELIGECRRRAATEGVTAIEFANTQIVTMRRVEPAFRELTSAYDFFAPDGMPLIWCLNARGAGMVDRVYGPTFMRECLRATPAPAKHYLLGGSAELGARLRAVIRQWNPATQIVGSCHGQFDTDGRLKDGGDDALLAEINALSPDFIWVGLGTPKQQAWIHRHKHQLKRGVLLGVGFGFDVNAGTKRDAPGWMQRRGLTWLFRLATEPRRLAGRYFKYNSLFVLFLLWDALRGKSGKTQCL